MLDWLKRFFQGISNPSSEYRKLQKPSQSRGKAPKTKTSPVHEKTLTRERSVKPPESPSKSSSGSVKSSTYEFRQTDRTRTSSPPSTLSPTHSQLATPVTQKAKAQISPPPSKPTFVWVPSSKRIKIKDYVIPGGMVYVGIRLQAEGSYPRVDPCLINPKLRVETSKPDYEGGGMGYWPSYSDIPPRVSCGLSGVVSRRSPRS